MTNFSRVYILSPSYATGGTELNHQLVHELNKQEKDAYICYIPFGENHQCPEKFKVYSEVRVMATPDDRKSSLIIIPESLTHFTSYFKNAGIAIWWQSIDNYFAADLSKPYISMLQKWRSLLTRKRVRLARLKKYSHFSQSYYAQRFLNMHGIPAKMLSDYINLEATKVCKAMIREAHYERKDLVLYNPMKGYHITKNLIQGSKEYIFIPLVGLSQEELCRLFNEAKIYIDFGNHPGKDRLPREAAINHCVVITGLHGSSGFSEDLPILNRYKLNTSSKHFITDFRVLVNDIFTNYEAHLSSQNDYRNSIDSEYTKFRAEVSDLPIATNRYSHDRFA